jgi:hypothetical protein
MLSTIDLLVMTSKDQLFFQLKILLISNINQANLMGRSTVLSSPPQLGFQGHRFLIFIEHIPIQNSSLNLA